ncbi:MAG TPA: RNA polymerase sigma factor [Acidimicrobiia bacterium]|jgi:RNA polymerase sigma-70 factor (ECF subfamily)
MVCTGVRESETIDEDVLVAAARAGDDDAFGALYRAHVEAVRRYVRARTDRTVADDLTAETFARAYRALPRYELRGAPFRAWLYRIAANLVIARARRAVCAEAPRGLAELDRVIVPSPDHAEAVVAAKESSELVECLGRLSGSHEQVLRLRYLSELSVSETADALGLKEPAVRSLTYRALRSLRAEYSNVKALEGAA